MTGDAAPEWEMLGKVDRVNADTPFYLLQSLDGTRLCMARRESSGFIKVAGPYVVGEICTLASQVLAGDHRAITGPETVRALALFISCFQLISTRAKREVAQTSGDPPTPEEAPPGTGCTTHARAAHPSIPTQETAFACTPCGDGRGE